MFYNLDETISEFLSYEFNLVVADLFVNTVHISTWARFVEHSKWAQTLK